MIFFMDNCPSASDMTDGVFVRKKGSLHTRVYTNHQQVTISYGLITIHISSSIWVSRNSVKTREVEKDIF
jgi:hypothetical protein